MFDSTEKRGRKERASAPHKTTFEGQVTVLILARTVFVITPLRSLARNG